MGPMSHLGRLNFALNGTYNGSISHIGGYYGFMITYLRINCRKISIYGLGQIPLFAVIIWDPSESFMASLDIAQIPWLPRKMTPIWGLYGHANIGPIHR